MKKIVLTGGGTAGHVTPNMALIERLKQMNYEISYIGSVDGIEKGLIEGMRIPYYGISSGKLRRYFSFKNFTDPFRVLKGYFQAKRLLREIDPDVVFSKGGFVAVPVVYAAKKRGIPAVIHESDMTPGLANKLCIKKAAKICCNFEATLAHLPAGKAVHTGTPLRKELFNGSREKGLEITGFTNGMPVLMVVGGSTGAARVNEAVRKIMPRLLEDFQVIHICGKGKTNPDYDHITGLRQYEYVSDDLKDMFAVSDIVISRAGANAVSELLALKKPNILIPLSIGSRGDQVLNAEAFEKNGYSYLLREEDLNEENLLKAVETVNNNREKYVAAMETATERDATEIIAGMLDELATNR
ncbi:MAG: undecaprenyldiphospho-muramoylpentapeptide beta-N-acetylglucosaminyltransferase [Lachnospiraceae bacterium]|nr:undecaprenyldiphospho-muramoylpentapeptide beta-N-acetylglucosaminyltransferase [Lachnospiraceae bacterium]